MAALRSLSVGNQPWAAAEAEAAVAALDWTLYGGRTWVVNLARPRGPRGQAAGSGPAADRPPAPWTACG